MGKSQYLGFYHDKNLNPVPYTLSTIIRYLKGCFRVNDELGYALCDEEDMQTSASAGSLLITDQNSWDTVFRGHAPSITVRRGAMEFGAGIQGYGASRELDRRVGEHPSILEWVQMPVVISCKAREEIEAETLAFLVHHFLTSDMTWAKIAGLRPLPGSSVLPPVPYKPQEQLWICDSSFVFVTNRSYKSKLIGADLLQEILFTFDFDKN